MACMESAETEVADTLTRRARLGLVLGPALFALMLAIPAPEGLSAGTGPAPPVTPIPRGWPENTHGGPGPGC